MRKLSNSKPERLEKQQPANGDSKDKVRSLGLNSQKQTNFSPVLLD